MVRTILGRTCQHYLNLFLGVEINSRIKAASQDLVPSWYVNGSGNDSTGDTKPSQQMLPLSTE